MSLVILAAVRLEAGTPNLQPIAVPEFIDEVAVAAAIQAQGSGHSLLIEPVDSAIMVTADRQLLASALTNLLQNAFKFTPVGGEVSLVTHATPDRVRIEVSDQCGGLPPGRADELFLPFSQSSADRSGLGLGLTIALRAVRANAGELSVRDVPGSGCVFAIDLPRAPPPATPLFRVPPHGDRGAPDASGNGSRSGAHSREPRARAR